MDIKRTTLVTAIFDIGRDKWSNFTMSYHTYLWWMRNILYLDTNLIIYTEEKFRKDILDYRKEVDPNLKKTILIIQPLQELKGYKLFADKLDVLMESDAFKSKVQFDVPEMNKHLYNVVMFNKVFYIQDALEKNLFNSDLYVWADAGVIRNDVPIKNRLWPNLQKINLLNNNQVTFFCHHDYVSIHDKQDHALSQMRFIQGGAIFVPRGCVNDLCNEFEKTVEECLQEKFIGSDEKIFDLLYIKNPNNYNLIKCNWREYIDLFEIQKDLHVVVARFNEDVEWTNEIKYPVTIFNKNSQDHHKFKNNLQNVGRESFVYFNYIIDNYDNLPEYIAFVQGNPFDHCFECVDQINNFDFKTEFLPLGIVHTQTTEHETINNQVEKFSKTHGFPVLFPTHMVRGAQFIISKRIVLKKSKVFYQNILNELKDNIYPQASLDIEKLLFQIFDLYDSRS